MKKFIALAIAIIMMAAIAVPAFAGEIVFGDEENVGQSSSADITYGVSKSYTVTVPAELTFGQNGGAAVTTATVSATNVVIAGNETLKVAISSATEGNGAWTMRCENNNPVEYKASKSEITVGAEGNYDEVTALVDGAYVLEVGTNQAVTTTASATVYFATLGTTQSGVFTDTLTFTASIA